jgi:hypothetical protein
MINFLAKRVSELFHIQISDDAYSISLFELGLSVEQVLYFLLDISKSQNFNLEEYYNAIRNCSLIEIQNLIRK